MRRAVSGKWASLYFDALFSLDDAVTRGTISRADFFERVAAINDWLRERNLAVVPDRDVIAKSGLRCDFVRNPKAQ